MDRTARVDVGTIGTGIHVASQTEKDATLSLGAIRIDGGTQTRAESEDWIHSAKSWTIDPNLLFIDITYLHGEDEVKAIREYCNHKGYSAFFDYDAEAQWWVWHTLVNSKGEWRIKKAADKFKNLPPKLQPPAPLPLEVVLQMKLGNTLKARGEQVRYEVHCSSGRADIVTDDGIYEIKQDLTRESILNAIGQLMLYRSEINPNARLYIAGRETKDTRTKIEPARRLGIEIIVLE